jgi:hypothetical protein
MPGQPTGSLEHVDDDCFVIVKAAPRASQTHGETVCIAAVDRSGAWVRLYPVSFRDLADAQRFGRWDHLRFRWRRPRTASDARTESRRVDASSIVIVGQLPTSQRNALLNRIAVRSLKKERAEGRSLALLRPEIIRLSGGAANSGRHGEAALNLRCDRSAGRPVRSYRKGNTT